MQNDTSVSAGDYVIATDEIECDAPYGRVTRITTDHYEGGTVDVTYHIQWRGAPASDPHGPDSFQALTVDHVARIMERHGIEPNDHTITDTVNGAAVDGHPAGEWLDVMIAC